MDRLYPNARMAAWQQPSSLDPHDTDPVLLKEHSHFRSFRTSRFEYPEIRVFFRQHAKADQLPKDPAPLPLLVCVPGLGGSVAQFQPLLSSLVDLAPCFAIDYPGAGRSRFAPTDWEAYTSEALSDLLETAIEEYRDTEAGQQVVLIGHSMGTALSARLANTKVAHPTDLAQYVAGLVGVCPMSGPLDESTTAWARRLSWIPGRIFDLWRSWDSIGGLQSSSVTRFVGADADLETKSLQYRYNKQNKTPVWRRMFYGMQATYKNGLPFGGIPGLDVWAGLDIPVYLIAGEKDNILPPRELEKIVHVLASSQESRLDRVELHNELTVDTAAPVSTSMKPKDHLPKSIDKISEEDFLRVTEPTGEGIEDDAHNDPSTPTETLDAIPPQPRHPRKVVQSIIMPSPASHALLYMPRSVHVLAGLISDFLATHVTGRLSLAWQLQYLSREGKWDVKNLNKWKSVAPVSDVIGPEGKPIFRAMKTLREVDETHCPRQFIVQWGNVIKDIVDISKDQPVYDPRALERAGIRYHKFPTVSKIPPQAHDVETFISVIDKIRQVQAERAAAEGWDDPNSCVIGVHCHYGFNRTGYLIVCYLVERCEFGVKEAIELFAKARPNGIRHSHFLDRLYVRYNLEAGSAACDLEA